MNPDFDELAYLAWVQLWQVTVVALTIGAVVRLCCRDRPRLAHALWMLVVVKSIVPPAWSSPTGLFSWALVGRALTDTRATASVGADPAGAASRVEGEAARDRGIDWTQVRRALFATWCTGLVLGFPFVLGTQLACSRRIRQSRVPVDERYRAALADLSRRLRVRRRVRLIVTSRPIGPAVFGLFRPSILLPAPLLAGMPPEQIELVLAHELIHVRRGDVLAGKLQLVAQWIWWFNPLVWWANRQAVRARERCCDQEVVAGVGCKPGVYARTLVSVLEQKGRLRSLVAIPGVRALEVTSLRLESIMKYAETDQKRASLLSHLTFAAGAVLLVPGAGLTLETRAADHSERAAAVEKTQAEGRPDAIPAQVAVPPKGTSRERQAALQKAEERVRWAEKMFAKGYLSKTQLDAERANLQTNPAQRTDPPTDTSRERQAALQKAEDRVRWAEKMFAKGYLSKRQLDAERANLQAPLGQERGQD